MSFLRICLSAALAGLALPAPLPAQAALEGVLAEARRDKVSWILLHRAEDDGAYAAQRDEVLWRLAWERQLVRTDLPAAAAAEVWQARSWPAAVSWVLLSDQGVEAGTGPGTAQGEPVLALLRQKGLLPGWEARQAFLRQHPESGEVWALELRQATHLGRARMQTLGAQGRTVRGRTQVNGFEVETRLLAEPDPAAKARQADQIFGELADALKGIRGVDGWWRSGPDEGLLFTLFGAGDAPRVRAISALLAQDLEQALGRQGPEQGLERLITYRVLAGRPLRDLPEGVAVPGGAEPPLRFLTDPAGALAGQRDWEGVLAFLDGFPLPGPQGSWTPTAWQSHCLLQATVASLRVQPNLELGRAPQARAALEDWRRWAGVNEALRDLGTLLMGPRVAGDEATRDLLKAPPLPDPAMPPPPPVLRLALLGTPSWQGDWQRLRASDALLPWGPGELHWVTPAPGEEAALRRRAGWGPEPHWALLRGEEVLASGTRCPAPTQVATLAGREGPSLLQQLHRTLESHPGHLGARRARLAILKARMPEPRLEPLLAEDASVAFTAPYVYGGTPPLDFGPDAPWKPDPALWQWSAQQVLPRVEARLRSWPSDPGLWRVWLAWAPFHPSRPSVVAFADTLPVLRSRSAWLGSLPPEVLGAVAQELRRVRNHPELVRWLGEAWEGLDRSPGSQVDPAFWPYLVKDREKLRQALVTPLAEAYRALGRLDEAKALEADYLEMMKR
jgi:hypothetical protein